MQAQVSLPNACQFLKSMLVANSVHLILNAENGYFIVEDKKLAAHFAEASAKNVGLTKSCQIAISCLLQPHGNPIQDVTKWRVYVCGTLMRKITLIADYSMAYLVAVEDSQQPILTDEKSNRKSRTMGTS